MDPSTPPSPDIVIADGHLFVTVAAPELTPGEWGHYVGTNLLIVWQREQPERSWMVRFPVDVLPERAVVRVNHGVLDLEVPLERRASPAAARPEGSP